LNFSLCIVIIYTYKWADTKVVNRVRVLVQKSIRNIDHILVQVLIPEADVVRNTKRLFVRNTSLILDLVLNRIVIAAPKIIADLDLTAANHVKNANHVANHAENHAHVVEDAEVIMVKDAEVMVEVMVDNSDHVSDNKF